MVDFYIQYISPHPLYRLYFILSLITAEIIAMYPCPMRKEVKARVVFSLLIYFVFSLAFPENNILNSIVSITILIFLLSIFLCCVCFQYSFWKIIFNCVGAFAIQNIAANIGQCGQILLQWGETWLFFCLECGLTAIIYLLFFLFIRKKNSKQYDLSMNRGKLLAISIMILSIVFLLMNALRIEGIGQMLICRLIITVSGICGLLYQYSSSENEILLSEKEMMERILKTEQERYKISNETVELVNMKYHDLKHILEMMTLNECKDVNGLHELQQAISRYDAVIQTGNSSLDSVLMSKYIYCQQNHIRFYYMAEGEDLDFISPYDLYSLFGNMLDNAIECQLKELEENRYISLTVSRKGEMISIYQENYLSRPIVFQDKLPISEKNDTRYHGFGTKSICYICQKYNGTVEFFSEENMFGLNALLPITKINN